MKSLVLVVCSLVYGLLPIAAQPSHLFFPSTAARLSQHIDIDSLTNPFLRQMSQPWTTALFPHSPCLQGDLIECVNRDLAGGGAINCGRVRVGASPELASKCVLKAFSEKKPFFVRYDQKGWNSESATGFAGTADGRVTEVEWDRGNAFPLGSFGRTREHEHVTTTSCDRLSVLKMKKDGTIACQPLFSRLHRELLIGKPPVLTEVNRKDWE